MMRLSLFVLPVALAAASPALAKKIVVAVDGPNEVFTATHEAVRAAGHEPVDVTGVYRRLFAVLSLAGLDLNNDTPPMGWPAKLQWAWNDVFAACGARRTEPTYTFKDAEARLCAQDAAYALWQLFLDEQGADEVLVVRAMTERKQGMMMWNVTAEVYAPGATSRRVIEASAANGGKLAARHVKQLFSGKGKTQPRLTTRTLPKNHGPPDGATVVEPRAPRRAKPAALPEGCKAPSALALRGEESVAGALSGIYLASVPEAARQGPPLSCELTWFVGNHETNEMFRGGSMRSYGAMLRCDEGATFRGRSLGISPTHAFEGPGGTKLIEGILKEVCAAQ